jgi:1-phosphatidylinositol-3-phosphate 5-kinase
MLELAPEYFKFTQSTYNKATSLVKIVGFFSGMFTARIWNSADVSVFTHDRKSGTKKNMDLLVMENLFHNHEITKTYDLKGIGESILKSCDMAERLESRKVAKPTAPPAGTAEAKAAGSATLWDGDWLEAISKRPVLIYPRQFFS